MRRFLTRLTGALILAVLCAVGATTTASAWSLPNPLDFVPNGGLVKDGVRGVITVGQKVGVVPDCKQTPSVADPNSGPGASIDPGPQKPLDGNPFGAQPAATAYDVYGWAGATWPNYDLGCGPDSVREPMNSGTGAIAQTVQTANVQGAALLCRTGRFVLEPSTIGVLDPINKIAAGTLGERVFLPLFAVSFAGVIAWLAFTKARHGDVGGIATAIGWAFVVMLIGISATYYPTKIAPQIDRVMTAPVTLVNQALGQASGTVQNQSASDSICSALQTTVVYGPWKNGIFGKSSGATVGSYADALFNAGTLTREEAALSTDERKAVIEKKQDSYKKIAAAVQRDDPTAYGYLSGHQNGDRIGYALAGTAALAVDWVFIGAFLLIVGYAMIVVRAVFIAIPLEAIISAVPAWRGLLLDTLNYALGVILCAMVFGPLMATEIFIQGLVLQNPSVPWLIGFLMMIGLGVAFLFFFRPSRLRALVPSRLGNVLPDRDTWRRPHEIKELVTDGRRPTPADRDRYRQDSAAEGDTTRDFAPAAEAGDTTRDIVPASRDDQATKPAATEPDNATPAGKSRTQAAKDGAQDGALQGAVVAAATGGASVVAGAAAGAAKGALKGGAASEKKRRAAADDGRSPFVPVGSIPKKVSGGPMPKAPQSESPYRSSAPPADESQLPFRPVRVTSDEKTGEKA